MIPAQRPSGQLLRLARLQSGVLSTEQVHGHGLGRSAIARLIRDERWRRLDPGLYLTREEDPDWMAQVWAGVLLGGDNARIGGNAALRLWGVLDRPPEEVVVLVPHARRPSSRGVWRFVRERPGVRGPHSFGDPPRLGLVDTVLDVSQESDERATVDVVLRAVQSRRVRPEQLRQAVERRARVPHRRLLTGLLADADEGAETALELRYLRDVERAHGLPRGRRQHLAHHARHVRDVKYDAYGLVVELDGRLGHEGMGRFRDMDRDNRTLLAGEQTLRYGWTDVGGRRCDVARQVGRALAQRGWPGLVEACGWCPRVPTDEWGS